MASNQGPEPLSTVHLNVPRALKARWVKASQRRGLKLTDHLLTLIERGEAMKTYLNNFPACKAELARELAALEARAPKSAEKRIEWAARVAAFRAVLA